MFIRSLIVVLCGILTNPAFADTRVSIPVAIKSIWPIRTFTWWGAADDLSGQAQSVIESKLGQKGQLLLSTSEFDGKLETFGWSDGIRVVVVDFKNGYATAVSKQHIGRFASAAVLTLTAEYTGVYCVECVSQIAAGQEMSAVQKVIKSEGEVGFVLEDCETRFWFDFHTLTIIDFKGGKVVNVRRVLASTLVKP